MPWKPDQWRAIAARTMREKGPVAGEAYLHKLKMEAGGHAVAKSGDLSARKGSLGRKLDQATRPAQRRRKRHRRG